MNAYSDAHEARFDPWKIVNLVAFHVGWFAAVLGASWGWPWAGVTIVAAVVALHLGVTQHRRRDVMLVAAAGLLGFGLDTAVIALGAYVPHRWVLPAPFSPLWLVAMWANFATTLDSSMGWLRGRYAVAAGLGALGGPMAYWAGARLGAIEFGPSPWMSVVVLAVAWAAAVPALVGLVDRLSAGRGLGRRQSLAVVEAALNRRDYR